MHKKFEINRTKIKGSCKSRRKVVTQIMEVTGFDNVRLPIYQSFTHNGFYNNFAYGLHCEKTTFGHCRWGNRATVVAGSAGQEYVDNIFYNHNNDYELLTLNRSIWDVWKTPINAKYNYWAYNETYAVAGRIKDLHDEEGLLEVDFTPFQMNNRTLLSGKCQPGWTLLDSTCYMYHGGPMTYAQAKTFCKKDNATIPYIKNIYWYDTLIQYLESQQEDWRYYDMVWVSDLDAPENHCTVFVDGSVERVSCDFLLPTLCEMDEHVALSVDFLKSEFVYAIVAAIVGILLIFIICCLWCTKSRQRREERFSRRNSIRMSKSSLAGSRSLASVASTGFSDINYRRRMNVAMSPNGSASKTGTINSRNGTYRSATRGGGAGGTLRDGSYDSLAEKMNSTVEEDLRSSFDMYDPHSTLGSHLAPVTSASFNDTHEVHYATGVGNPVNFAPNVHNATIHSTTGYNMSAASYADYASQPMSANNEWNRTSLASSQGPPGYPTAAKQSMASTCTPADSVLELKRGLKDQQQSNTSPITTSTSGKSLLFESCQILIFFYVINTVHISRIKEL